MRRTVTACVCIAWVAAVCVESSRSVQASAPQATPAPAPAKSSAPATPAGALVSKYCVTCHNERLKTAGLLLDKADADQVSNSADTWEKVVVQLRSRAMPPASMPRPDNATYDTVATWLETELDRAALARRILAGQRISIDSIVRNTPMRFVIS